MVTLWSLKKTNQKKNPAKASAWVSLAYIICPQSDDIQVGSRYFCSKVLPSVEVWISILHLMVIRGTAEFGTCALGFMVFSHLVLTDCAICWASSPGLCSAGLTAPGWITDCRLSCRPCCRSHQPEMIDGAEDAPSEGLSTCVARAEQVARADLTAIKCTNLWLSSREGGH